MLHFGNLEVQNNVQTRKKEQGGTNSQPIVSERQASRQIQRAYSQLAAVASDLILKKKKVCEHKFLIDKNLLILTELSRSLPSGCLSMGVQQRGCPYRCCLRFPCFFACLVRHTASTSLEMLLSTLITISTRKNVTSCRTFFSSHSLVR